ncbi:MAG: glycerophosphoryl diester phosphodiesterase [Chloroflexi bacterium]|jgi:glycerophosphoryl diester phosphodiesterase|nr:MAG: glycerophosphoryl diester phosphodiesterase [Chloroflexota bacterium]
MQRKITNIAHQGASFYAPENTRAAFDMTINMGVKPIEFDVHSSKDGRLVVIHDDKLPGQVNFLFREEKKGLAID